MGALVTISVFSLCYCTFDLNSRNLLSPRETFVRQVEKIRSLTWGISDDEDLRRYLCLILDYLKKTPLLQNTYAIFFLEFQISH